MLIIRLIALTCLVVLTGCKENQTANEVPIGPIDRFQGIELGVTITDLLGTEIETDEVFRLGGDLSGVDVGVLRDFDVEWRPGAPSFVFAPRLLTTDIYYNLETRTVFLTISTVRAPFFEADCRSWGAEVRRLFEENYTDVDTTLRSSAHGRVVIRPNQHDDASGFERQNTILGECPIGYRLTPNQPTHYEIWFSNGQLYEEVFRDSSLLPSPIL